MTFQDHSTRSTREMRALLSDTNHQKTLIRHTKIISEENRVSELFTAIEVLIWQLINRGVLPGELLADELMRHGNFHSDGGKTLLLLARLARAAAPSDADC